jgi:beta-lactamase superfamily II metal-dependent hydrolase
LRETAGIGELERLLEEGGEPQRNELVVTFFQTVLGDSYLLEFPCGSALLVDAGDGLRVQEILDYLQVRGIERLDGLLLTHPHFDHYGGMTRIVESVPVGTFFFNGVRRDCRSYRLLEEALDARGIPRRVLRRGDSLGELTGPDLTFEVLYPDEAALSGGGDTNRTTIILRLTHGSLRFLLAGDAEYPEEARLLDFERGNLAHQVLKLGHHGSPSSGSRAFLKAVKPWIAVVQGTELLDIDLFYPRPKYGIVRYLKREGVILLDTKKVGTVQLVSDGTRIAVRTLQDVRRRWGPSPPGFHGIAGTCLSTDRIAHLQVDL